MMIRSRWFTAVALTIAVNACGAPVRYALKDEPAYSLTIWLADAPLLNKEDALQACAEWLVKGVVCSLTDDEAKADVRVQAAEECHVNDDGNRTLAIAYRTGFIGFYSKCFRQRNGAYDRRMFRAVMTHEIGHVVGIWKHIPENCGIEAARHPSGQRICGPALMNPHYRNDVWFVSVIDALAFDVRDEAESVLEPLRRDDPGASTDTYPTCVYLSR